MAESSEVWYRHLSTPTSVLSGNGLSALLEVMAVSVVHTFLSTFGCGYRSKAMGLIARHCLISSRVREHGATTYGEGDVESVVLGHADLEEAEVGVGKVQHHHTLDLQVLKRAVARALKGDLLIDPHMDTVRRREKKG